MSQNENSKALSLEHKADSLAKKEKPERAIKIYLKALDLAPGNISLIDKLITTHESKKEKWTEEDFVFHLELTMKKQELLDPAFKRYHARHDVDFKNVSRLIQQMLAEKDKDKETALCEKIVSYGEKSLYPLIDTIISFKELRAKLAKS